LTRTALPASRPPSNLPELDPTWSRLVTTTDETGAAHTWHVLDSGPPDEPVVGTLLCVHGNPTWSYLWRRLVAAPPPGWRVVAPDQLGMGFSERTATPRTLRQRVDDLGDLTDALGIDGPVVTVAHDWGGPISLGWAEAHADQLRGIVLTNTGVAQPPGSAAPSLIRLARTPLLRETVCVRTPTFVRSTTALSRPALRQAVRDAIAAPYASGDRRGAVGDFVADIPLEEDHVSAKALQEIRDGLAALADVPALLLWGPRDPVFSERYLRDLLVRLPQADVQRYEGASHLVTEDAPQAVAAIAQWIIDLTSPTRAPVDHEVLAAPPLWGALADRAADPATAIVELGSRSEQTSFDQLEAAVRDLAAGLAAHGVRPGDRVALLVPPGAELAAALYACWRIGAVVVIADAGLGLPGLGRALRGASPDHVIGIRRGLAASAAMRVPGRRIAAGAELDRTLRALGAVTTLGRLAELGRGRALPPPPDQDAECAVIFTSGATGPSKGVVYRHRQVQAQVAALRSTYKITRADRLVAAFAPFALYGPMLGIPSAVPDVDVTAPADLTARALADAVAAIDATLVFASPGALRNVVATAGALQPHQHTALASVRLLLSAGAPVPVELLREVQRLVPNAELHTPYGMTEALPITSVSLAAIEAAGDGQGVCVGRPIAGVDVAVSPLGPTGAADGPLTTGAGVTGEICVRGDHVKDRYDRLWATQRDSARDRGWHRTSDVGHLDADGRLWVEGRLAHVIVTPRGLLTPVGIEQRVAALHDIRDAAAVGVGPRGTQQVVAVVVLASGGSRRRALAGTELTAAVRTAAGVDVTAVLVADRLPVDIRHQSKIDRARVSAWAERALAGDRVGRRP
jgi:acyl-coenzyme A synthetase/AMP-(fatty) acid ligase/pimeloyl-ACP methyl ester carboxylesterase